MTYRLVVDTHASDSNLVTYLTNLVEEAECLFRLRDLSYQPGIKFKIERLSEGSLTVLLTSQQLYDELLNPSACLTNEDVDWASVDYLHVNKLVLKPLEGVVPTFRLPF